MRTLLLEGGGMTVRVVLSSKVALPKSIVFPALDRPYTFYSGNMEYVLKLK